MLTATQKRKKQERQNLQDILTTLLVAFIVVLAYKDRSLSAETFGDIALAMIPTLILVGLIFASLLAITRSHNQIKRAEERGEEIRPARLEWGQKLKHNLLIGFTPI